MHRELTEAELATNAKTWDHINRVMELLSSAQIELMRRAFTHDRSKLRDPEVAIFTEFTPKLKASTYGSEEYHTFLNEMSTALDHHYAHNRHHPEFFTPVPDPQEALLHSANTGMVEHIFRCSTGESTPMPDDSYGEAALLRILNRMHDEYNAPIACMNLFDLLEMFIDWAAASERHADGDIRKSIEINKDRFLMSPQLVKIFENTVKWLGNPKEFTEATQRDLRYGCDELP